MEFLGKGKRSSVYCGYYKNIKAAIKIPKKGFEYRISNEAKCLEILNRNGIGPKLLYNNEYLVYEFVEGTKILDWIKINNKNDIMKALKMVMMQCRKMDILKVNKYVFPERAPPLCHSLP